MAKWNWNGIEMIINLKPNWQVTSAIQCKRTHSTHSLTVQLRCFKIKFSRKLKCIEGNTRILCISWPFNIIYSKNKIVSLKYELQMPKAMLLWYALLKNIWFSFCFFFFFDVENWYFNRWLAPSFVFLTGVLNLFFVRRMNINNMMSEYHMKDTNKSLCSFEEQKKLVRICTFRISFCEAIMVCTVEWLVGSSF